MVEHVGHRRGVERIGEWEAPKLFASDGVSGRERAAIVAVDDDAAGGGESAGPSLSGTVLRDFPYDSAGLNVEGAEDFLGLVIGSTASTTARIATAGPPFGGGVLAEDRALFEGVDVE